MIDREYLKTLEKRVKSNRIVKEFQDTALIIAELLDDTKHTALYMKLAKEHPKQELLRIAKDVAERHEVSHKGAYFMGILKERGFFQSKSNNAKHTYRKKA
ncbi:hypothetical protein A2935_03955 [Candidatus Wolfebacteria bacterium RIFCSPLOWO2_01_FULL_47_17b]|uniref:Uncharacterized protein n=1 Tax=Candidatus Wolfebacteria bacterium RIFCSPLOWO2_01_FULL_47_17b TaxID=1802558 RepID=A0A1F8DVK7_9BACT|nr:MAG: hypothetical protein A2935_03955 [Candidatus Wolfebacteria bacterium RIFCSPLOWO2_01_FULL_47_17b]